jgi:hypothetical protein
MQVSSTLLIWLTIASSLPCGHGVAQRLRSGRQAESMGVRVHVRADQQMLTRHEMQH